MFSSQLQCLEGNILVATEENKVEVPSLKLDEEGELMVPFIASLAPGRYERYLNFISYRNLVIHISVCTFYSQ